MALAVAACADQPRGQWENPKVPWEQWDDDRTECRQLAEERAEEEFSLSRGDVRPRPGASRLDTFEESQSRFEASRLRDRLFERCMTARGYRLVPRAE